jgi:hypothetical protein
MLPEKNNKKRKIAVYGSEKAELGLMIIGFILKSQSKISIIKSAESPN